MLVTSYSETLHFVGRHYTTTKSTYVDAHLSLPYAVAVAIADAEYGWRQQSSGRIADPAVHDLASRVTVDVDESMDETYPDDWPVRVEITLKDGRKVADRLDRVTGCPNRPMTDAELCGKFVGNVEGVDRRGPGGGCEGHVHGPGVFGQRAGAGWAAGTDGLGKWIPAVASMTGRGRTGQGGFETRRYVRLRQAGQGRTGQGGFQTICSN